jgi:hypothetical protein
LWKVKDNWDRCRIPPWPDDYLVFRPNDRHTAEAEGDRKIPSSKDMH